MQDLQRFFLSAIFVPAILEKFLLSAIFVGAILCLPQLRISQRLDVLQKETTKKQEKGACWSLKRWSFTKS